MTRKNHVSRFRPSPLFMAMLLGSSALTALSANAMQMELNASSETINVPVLRGQLSNGNNAFLQGAIIRLVGAGRETVTDSTGRFRFDNLPEGEYQVEVSYLGYGTHKTTAQVTAQQGQVLQLRFVDASEIEVMQIVGNRNAQARALNIQRSSDNIKSVVSADYLGRFPDANVAESAQRLPGVSIQRDQGEGRYVNVRGAPLEFANVSVNGVVLPSPDGTTRAIDLDTIPSDVIATMELTKAITPDMDADAIAGNINVVTQGALDSKEAFVRANLASGKNQKGSGDITRGGVTVGSRIANNDNMGVLLSASYSETERVTDNVEHMWFEADNGEFLPEVTEFKDYELTRKRTGLSGRFDWRPSDNSHLFLSHNFSRFKDDEYRDTLLIEYERFSADSTSKKGVAGRATIEKELRHRTVVNTINSTQFGGNHYFDDFKLDYSVAYSKASQKYPNRDYLLYRENSRPALAYDFSNSDLPYYQVLDGAGDVVRDNFNFGSDEYSFRRYERRFGEAEEEEAAYAFNVTIPGQLGTAHSKVKFGAKARLKDKFNDEDRFRNSEGAQAPSFADVAINKESRPFSGHYHNGPKLQRDFIAAYGSALEDADYKDRGAASVTSDYNASEDTYAAYAMNTLEWDSITFVYGLRVEQTKTSGEAATYDTETDEFSLLRATNRYTKVFPGAHLRYETQDGVILRAAYSTGINRPNFVDLVPYVIVEDRTEGFGSIDIGNIDLKPTYAHNLDLMAEYYVEPLGLMSAGIFYKRLNDPIFKARSVMAEGEYAGFNMVRPENGHKGRLYGAELNWQQTLDMIPGVGFSANYTFTDSSADLPFNIGETDLPGTSRHTYNLALNYERYGISAQLAYNFRSEYIDSLDTANPGLNTYWDDRATLDFSASYQLTEQFSLYAEATNLTDSKAIRYQGERSRVFEHEQFGRTWLLGVRGSF